MRRRALALAALLATLAPAARADDARARAGALFDAAAAAYEAGQFLVAAEAFEKANALLPSASFLFSAAQAYRKEYLARAGPAHLRKAVALYRAYLAADPNGKRSAEALAALEALVPLEGRLPADAPAAPEKAPDATRLLLTAKPDGAEVSVDGGAFVPTPAVVKVEPGARALRFRAPGCEDATLTVTALSGELVPGSASLRERLASLRITGADGARVVLDGRLEGSAPAPLALAPGPHALVISLRGHEPFAVNLTLAPDEHRALSVRLSPTRQRVAALATLGVGAGGLALAGGLGLAALVREGDAGALWDRRATEGLGAAERDAYNLALAQRNALTLASGVAAGLSAAALAVGVGLYFFDEPRAPRQTSAWLGVGGVGLRTSW